MADSTLLLPAPHLAELRRLIAAHLPREEVWAHGSRVTGTGHDTSDLDLVVRHPADILEEQGVALEKLQEALRESNLPYLIELLDWAVLPAAFRANIAARPHVVLYSPKSEPDLAGRVSETPPTPGDA